MNAQQYVQQVSREEILREIDTLAHDVLECDRDEAFRRLDKGELDEYAVSSQLRMWRFLLDETIPLAAE